MEKKHIMVKDVRCSFPRMYGNEIRDGDTFGPGIALILEKEKHGPVLKMIKEYMREAITNNPKLVKAKEDGKLGPDRMCLRLPDRDEMKYMEGNLMVKANNPRAPLVLHPDGRTVMTEATNLIYSGCYVNAKIEIWGQANKYGKRVNAKLIAVQFVNKPAESFDGSYVSPEEAVKGFESLDDGIPDDDLLGGGEKDTPDDDLLGGGTPDDDDLLG